MVALGSGSKGNCLVIEFGETRIAVDAGFGPRTLVKRLRTAGIAPESISACVITHEHLDHAQGALAARHRWRWTLVATPPTLGAIGAGIATARVRPTPAGRTETIGAIKVTLVPVPHDAIAPVAVLFEDTASGARVGVAHDLGIVPAGLHDAFTRLDLLVLESNHDMGMLRAGTYPLVLQGRIAGPRGHLSNLQAAHFAARVAHKGLRGILLAHLSRENNTPATALSTMNRALRDVRFRGPVVAASQQHVTMIGEARTAQLALF